MPVLEPHHDLAHPIEGDEAWSESYYFNGYDPSTDTGLFTRIGIRPPEGTMDVGLSVWLPDGELAEYRHVVECHEMVGPPLTVDGVRYEVLQPMQRWRVRADVVAPVRALGGRGSPGIDRSASIELDVTFDHLTAPIGSDGRDGRPRGSAASGRAAATTGKGHFEQAGRWTGQLTVDGRTITWSDARGNRDRSWGPRSWAGPSMWRWFSINLGADLHLGGILLDTADGELHRGWVSDAGTATSIRAWDVRTETESDGLTQRVVHLGATNKRGSRYDLVGRVLRVADIGRPGGTVINEGLTEWTYHPSHGPARVGYGIAEYLHQVDASGRPRVPVA